MKLSHSPLFYLSPFAFVVAFSANGLSQDPAAGTPSFEVRQIEGALHSLGDIRFDSAKRTVHFPATVNMTEGAIEFALVGTQGKIHESVFATEIRPMHLRAVFSLLDFEPSPLPEENGEKSPEGKNPALVQIDVSWPDPERPEASEVRNRVSLRKCILVMEIEPISPAEEKVRWQPLPEGPWAYTGSRFDAQGFEAERELDFIGVQHRPSALLNLPHPHTDRDDLWQANGEALPEKDTPVTIEITLPEKPAQ